MPPPGSKLIGLLKPDASDEEIEEFVRRVNEMAALPADSEESAQRRPERKPKTD